MPVAQALQPDEDLCPKCGQRPKQRAFRLKGDEEDRELCLACLYDGEINFELIDSVWVLRP